MNNKTIDLIKRAYVAGHTIIDTAAGNELAHLSIAPEPPEIKALLISNSHHDLFPLYSSLCCKPSISLYMYLSHLDCQRKQDYLSTAKLRFAAYLNFQAHMCGMNHIDLSMGEIHEIDRVETKVLEIMNQTSLEPKDWEVEIFHQYAIELKHSVYWKIVMLDTRMRYMLTEHQKDTLKHMDDYVMNKSDLRTYMNYVESEVINDLPNMQP